MVDITRDLVDQIFQERLRKKAQYNTRPTYSYGEERKTWRWAVFAYDDNLPDRLESIEIEMAAVELTDALKLGCNLPEMIGCTYTASANNKAEGSLLNIGTALMYFGDEASKDTGRKILNKVRENCRYLTKVDDYSFYALSGWPNPTTPEMFDMEPFEFDGHLFGINQLNWFGPQTGHRLVTAAHNKDVLGHISLLSSIGGDRWEQSIVKLAESYLRQHVSWNPTRKSKRIDYVRAAKAMRVCSLPFFNAMMAKCKGTRQALGTVRADAPPAAFSRGLAKLGGYDAIREVLCPWVGRSLVPSDIGRMSGPGLVSLLWHLPWERVEDLARNHIDEVRPKLLSATKHLDSLERLRECLTDHGKRPEAKELRLKEDTSQKPNDWEEHMKPLIEQYEANRDFKLEAKRRGLNQDHLMLLCLMESPHIEKLAQTIPLGPVLRELREKCLEARDASSTTPA